jgi:hypothetical protein
MCRAQNSSLCTHRRTTGHRSRPRNGLGWRKWRVSSWPQVFDPPQPPAPLGSPPEEDDGHRYDDPFRTLYCATEAEGALGECLGDFVFNTAAVVRIEAFLESEPEPGFDEDYNHPLRPEDIKAFDWKLGHAPAHGCEHACQNPDLCGELGDRIIP